MFSLSSYRGQSYATEILKSIVKTHTTSPRSIILYGPSGCGKTSMAKSFAYAINCMSGVRGDVCSVCSNCLEDEDQAKFFVLLSSIDEQTFARVISNKQDTVIIVDNVDKQYNQSILSRLVETYYKRFFFVFTTDDILSISDRIVSRSVDIKLSTPSLRSVCMFLRGYADENNIDVDNKKLYEIALVSGGNFNKALVCLERREGTIFRDLELVYLELILDMSDKDEYSRQVKLHSLYSLKDLKDRFYKVVSNLVSYKVGVEVGSPYEETYKQVVDKYGKVIFDIVKFSGKDWVVNGFSNEYSYVAVMLSLRELLYREDSTKVKVNNIEKFKKRV